jgi:hypothetical protein
MSGRRNSRIAYIPTTLASRPADEGYNEPQGFPNISAVDFIDIFSTFDCEPGSSVSIVSDYGLYDRVIEVQSLAEAKGFFLYPLCPDRLWGHPVGTGGPFAGAKVRPGRDADHSPPSSAEVDNE